MMKQLLASLSRHNEELNCKRAAKNPKISVNKHLIKLENKGVDDQKGHSFIHKYLKKEVS